MYSQNYASQSPGLSNNPFIDDPSNPHTRYPDISSSIPQDLNGAQYNSWSQSPGGNNYAHNTMLQPRMSSPQPGQQFQPSSSFGQQLVAQANGSGYGQIPGAVQPTGYPAQYQNASQTGYAGQPPQMQYSNPGYQGQQPLYSPGMQSSYGLPQMQPQPTGYQDVAQFDPYGPITQGWGEGQAQTQPSPASPSNSSTSYNGHLHPREFIRKHKAELEIWDPYSWKQALNTFDALKDAWATRKKDVEGRIAQVQRDYGYTGQQEVERLQGVWKQADSNFDSVTASSFQMHEVFQGYRQSGDQASKRRVREATNAALTSLPDWPTQSY
jgi:hypothetical protein